VRQRRRDTQRSCRDKRTVFAVDVQRRNARGCVSRRRRRAIHGDQRRHGHARGAQARDKQRQARQQRICICGRACVAAAARFAAQAAQMEHHGVHVWQHAARGQHAAL
jgi:hypothetical protein